MKVLAQNRRARFDYDIIDTVEAGVMLTGQEVKSCRAGNVHLSGAYVSFIKGNPILKNTSIALYKYAQSDLYQPTHDRRLLLRDAEMTKLQRMLEEKGVTIVPLEIRAGRFIKVLLGVGRGRRKYDKRERIKERDIQRQIKRNI